MADKRATFGTARSIRMTWCLTAFAALYTMAGIPGAKAAGVAASYCLTIAVNLEETPALVERFDDFAQRAGLQFEVGDPGGRYYFDSSETEMVALRNGMGEVGSVLSYFPLKDRVQSDLLGRLQRFVGEQIAPRYETTLCSNVEDLGPPVLHLHTWHPLRT